MENILHKKITSCETKLRNYFIIKIKYTLSYFTPLISSTSFINYQKSLAKYKAFKSFLPTDLHDLSPCQFREFYQNVWQIHNPLALIL